MTSKMRGVQYGPLTEEQIKAMSVVNVTEYTLHSRGIPKANSPADTRFGTCSRFKRCGTCKNTMKTCPCHSGHMELDVPLPHIGFLPYTIKVLNMVCFVCSSFLLPDLVFPSKVKTPERKMAYSYEECRRARSRKRCALTCPNCGIPQPIIRCEEPFFVLDWFDDVVEEYFKKTSPKKSDQETKPSKGKKRALVDEDDELVKDETKDATKDATKDETNGEGVVCSMEEIQAKEERKADYEYFVKRPFTNWDAYNVLRSIKKSDLPKMGMNPENSNPAGFMLTCLLIPAIGVRPTMSFEEGSKRSGYHQLTRTLSEIVKLNRNVRNEASKHRIRLDDQDAPHVYPESLSQAIKLLYFNISNYLVKNKCRVHKLKLSPYAARAHTRKKGLNQALGGKEGRYRAQLLGRRVDFCLRTVVTPNPDSDIDEIGIPRALARRLTIPIRVTSQNKNALQKLMSEGEIQQIVDEYTGDMIGVGDHNKDTLPLMTGWVVERFLRDGDIIPINRQPTLHRPSIMGHRVKVHDDLTLKLNPATMTAYNADCDGDEMNGHVPQTSEARAEVQELMHVPFHMINPRANRPIITPIQDYLDSAYYMSKQTVLLNRTDASQLLMSIKYNPDADPCIRLGRPGAEMEFPKLPVPAIVYPEERWTGKQIISCVLPNIHMKRSIKNRGRQMTDDKMMEADGVVEIIGGQLLRGTLCKQTLGGSAGGIIHMIAIYRSNHAASRFISDIQRVLNAYLMREGFSAGLRDCMSTEQIKGKTQTVIEAAEQHIAEILKIASEFPNDPEIQELAEDQLRNTLKSMAFMVGNVVRAHLDDTNRFNVMANTVGSKGSVFNMGQIMAAVLQTFVNGERPDCAGSNRVLPSAPLLGQEPLSLREELNMRGFIRTPYKAGLTPVEAYMHNTGGREGLVDTAAKVARTGYLQRRLVKTTEGHHVAHDGTIRDAYQSMYQTHFGTDGMDPMKTIKVELKSLLLNDEELRQRFIVPMPHEEQHCRGIDHHEWCTLRECRDEMRRAKQTSFIADLRKATEVYIPFDANVLAQEQQAQCNCHSLGEPTPTDLVQSYWIVDKLCRQLKKDVPALFCEYHIRTELSTGSLKRRHMCSGCVLETCRRALRMHKEALLQAGEGIGVVTATSMGEPMSQLTLNSFHTSGAANSGMTYGIPRMKELIGATRNTLTPLITLYIKENLPNAKNAAEMLARHLPYTVLRNIVKMNREVYEPNITECVVPKDKEMVRRHVPFLEHIEKRASHWVLRIELCKQRAGSRSLEPRSVADLIQDELQSGALVISSDVTDEDWIIRVYLLDVEHAVDVALKKSCETKTTRTAAKRVSQRQSMSTRKNRKYMDLTNGISKLETIPIPLHRISKSLSRTTHSPRDVVEWLVIRDHLSNLRDLRVCGIDSITSATVREVTSTKVNPQTGGMDTVVEHVVDARGTNLIDTSLLHIVDASRVVSNNVIYVYETYGITAAAHTLYNELCTCLSASGTRVDERMVKLAVDVITHNGYIMPVSRHGLNRLERHGALAKFTFEETVRMLFKAAAFGEYDPLLGVSETTIVGLEARMGCNLSQIYMDREGMRIPCNQAHAVGPSTASLDTRVLCSDFVGDEEDEEEVEDEASCFEESLDRILVSRNTRAGKIQSALSAGGEVPTNHLYRNQLYTPVQNYRINTPSHISSGSQGPFRPSSPILDTIEDMLESNDQEPFKPSSPCFDD